MSPGLYNYWMVIVLMMTGLYVVMARPNLVKKIMGVAMFQMSVIMIFITMGKVRGGTAPIFVQGADNVAYSNPVPHVLMLTAIVVGIATVALALALSVRVYEEFETLEDDELRDAELADQKLADDGAGA